MNQVNIDNMSILQGKKVIVTGPNRLIGRAVVDVLNKRGAIVIPCNHSDCDLTRYADTMQFFDDVQAEYCIHLAGYNGGIEFNRKYPADIFYRTSLINLNVLNSARIYGINKIVSVLASCAYPDNIPVLKEEDLWSGACNPTVECHGTAKRMLDVFSRCLRSEYGLNAVTCIMNNSFGPWDSIDPIKTKVVMALIKKYSDAKKHNLPQVLNWGDGSPLRQFIYSKDAGEALVQVLEKYDGTYPINLASPTEITIRDLATKISNLVGYDGNTVWNKNYPNGQMRKYLDTTKMQSHLDVRFTDFEVALKETIEWYNGQ